MNRTPESDLRSLAERPGSFLGTVKAVAWSFFGVRQRAAYEQDIQKLNPLHLIVAGILAAVVFVIALVVLVKWIVASGVATA